VREGLIDIVQTEAYAPLHVRSAQGQRGLRLAVDNDSVDEVDATATNEPENDFESDSDEDVTPADGDKHE
jgi:hypothetical protein